MATNKRKTPKPTILDYAQSGELMPTYDAADAKSLKRAAIENLHEVFERMGGVVGMHNWAKDNPTEFYKLWSKVLPKEVISQHKITDGEGQGVNIFISGQMSDAEIEAEFIGGNDE